MPDRPALSLAPAHAPAPAPSRRPSLRRSLSGAADPPPRSPLSQCTPVTPQNAHFWDSYFPPSLQTPPIGAPAPAQGQGFFAGGAFPGRRALLRRNSSLSSVASSVQDDEDEAGEPEWTAEEEEKVRLVRRFLPHPRSSRGEEDADF